MTASEAAEHQWLKAANYGKSKQCVQQGPSKQGQNQSQGKMEEITEEQQPSSIFIKPSLTSLESTAKDGREPVGPNGEFETNWLSSSHPFVSVSLSMEEEEEILDISSNISMVDESTTDTNGSLSLSQTPAVNCQTCPLLTGQKGDTVVEQEEGGAKEEKDTTGKEEKDMTGKEEKDMTGKEEKDTVDKEEKNTTDKDKKTISEERTISAKTNVSVSSDIRGGKNRRKRGGAEPSETVLDAKRKRFSQEEDVIFEQATTAGTTGFPKMRRTKRKRGRIAQDTKI